MLGGTPANEQLQALVDRCMAQKEQDDETKKVFEKSAESTGKQKLTDNREAASGFKASEKLEDNRAKNANKRAASTGIKARLLLIGYPLLKAKQNVTILNVGSEASGVWYVQNCTHSWNKGQGYRTEADLIRGGEGKGNKPAPQPIVFYGDIYKDKDAVYVGPRKVDSASQDTFTFGDGSYIEEFSWNVDAQTGRGAGRKVEGLTIDPNKASDPVEKVTSEKGSSDSDAPQI